MANLRGPGGFTNRNMIASFQDSQMTRDKDTQEINGGFLTVQIDQTAMTKKAAKEGKLDSNPYINSKNATGKDGTTKIVNHSNWYAISQINAIKEAGKVVPQADGKTTAVAFKGCLQSMPDAADPNRILVMTPKKLDGLEGDALKKAEAHNKRYPLGPSDNAAKFGDKSLAKQNELTALAKEARAAGTNQKAAPEKTAEATAEAEVG